MVKAWRGGEPPGAQPTVSATDRFWTKVLRADDMGCWLWTAGLVRSGYGMFWFDGSMVPVHRYAYELAYGPIPKGLELDHLCHVRHCVNPAHLEAVSHTENVRRGHAWRRNGTLGYREDRVRISN